MIKDNSVFLPGGSGVYYHLATLDDYINYYGSRPAYSARAYIFYKGDEPVGIGGYKLDSGRYILFSEIKESGILDKLTIVRAGKVIVSLIDELNVPVMASSKNERLCELFDGVKVGEDTYIWQN